MALFTYKQADGKNHVREGTIEAKSRDEVAEHIHRKGWYIVAINEEAGLLGSLRGRFQKESLTALERIIFTEHLASMMQSGTPILEALRTYQEEDDKRQSRITDEIIHTIQRGKTLSEAIAKFPAIFPAFYVSLLRAGELTGKLDETLWYVAGELRREHDFKERIKSALMYPAFVLAVAFTVIIFLVFLVIPKITQFTKSFGGELPLATRIIASSSTYLSVFGPLLLVAFIASIVALIVLLRNPKSRNKIDPYLLRLPLIGVILKKIYFGQVFSNYRKLSQVRHTSHCRL